MAEASTITSLDLKALDQASVDTYARISWVEESVQEQIAERLELRAEDVQQRAMRRNYLSEVGFPPKARVLDVGCGTGAVTRELAAWPGVQAVVGVDPSAVLLRRASLLAPGIENIEWILGDARALPIEEDACFDVVVFHTVLCHIPEPALALAEARRVLRPGGWLAIFDGDYATTTVALADHDPLQACAGMAMARLVHDRYLVRHLPSLVKGAGFDAAPLRSHGYIEIDDPRYMLAVIGLGADALKADGNVTAETAAALKAEAASRAQAGSFFGHIAYASLVTRVPDLTPTIGGQ